MKINEATSTDLKVIDALQNKYGWKPEDTLLYQQSYALTPEQQKTFPGIKTIKPDIVLTDLNHLPLAVFENKLDDEKKALTKLRTLYNQILRPRFLYACSAERILFYDTAWKGLEAGEFRRVNGFMTLEEMKLKIEQEKKRDQEKAIVIDRTIAGGYDTAAGKDRYFQIECIQTIIEKFRTGKQKCWSTWPRDSARPGLPWRWSRPSWITALLNECYSSWTGSFWRSRPWTTALA